MKGKTTHVPVVAMSCLSFSNRFYPLEIITTRKLGKPTNSEANKIILPICKSMFIYKADYGDHTIDLNKNNLSPNHAHSVPVISTKKVSKSHSQGKYRNLQDHDKLPSVEQKETRACYLMEENSKSFMRS